MGIKLAANPFYVSYAPKIRLDDEISNNGFLPRALGPDAKLPFLKSVMFQLDEEGLCFCSVLSPSALAYASAVG